MCRPNARGARRDPRGRTLYVLLTRRIRRIGSAGSAIRDVSGPCWTGFLTRAYVLTRAGKATIAGLIAMGDDSNYFHPGLRVQFVAWATDVEGASDDSGVRYVDNPPMVNGPLPQVFARVLARVKNNLRTGTRIDLHGSEVPEYPDTALREAIVNALVHRTLHPASLNSVVKVSVFPNRIEIVNPGGLFQVGVDEDGGPVGRSTRNSRLMDIMRVLPLASGTTRSLVETAAAVSPQSLRKLRKAGLQQPRFRDEIHQFSLHDLYLLLRDEGSMPFPAAIEGRSFARHWTPFTLISRLRISHARLLRSPGWADASRIVSRGIGAA